MKKYLEITDAKTKEVIKRMDVTDKSERHIERIEMGILMQMNRDKYYVGEVESKTELKVF